MEKTITIAEGKNAEEAENSIYKISLADLASLTLITIIAFFAVYGVSKHSIALSSFSALAMAALGFFYKDNIKNIK